VGAFERSDRIRSFSVILALWLKYYRVTDFPERR
jgi:hypothetical protein